MDARTAGLVLASPSPRLPRGCQQCRHSDSTANPTAPSTYHKLIGQPEPAGAHWCGAPALPIYMSTTSISTTRCQYLDTVYCKSAPYPFYIPSPKIWLPMTPLQYTQPRRRLRQSISSLRPDAKSTSVWTPSLQLEPPHLLYQSSLVVIDS